MMNPEEIQFVLIYEYAGMLINRWAFAPSNTHAQMESQLKSMNSIGIWINRNFVLTRNDFEWCT